MKNEETRFGKKCSDDDIPYDTIDESMRDVVRLISRKCFRTIGSCSGLHCEHKKSYQDYLIGQGYLVIETSFLKTASARKMFEFEGEDIMRNYDGREYEAGELWTSRNVVERFGGLTEKSSFLKRRIEIAAQKNGFVTRYIVAKKWNRRRYILLIEVKPVNQETLTKYGWKKKWMKFANDL